MNGTKRINDLSEIFLNGLRESCLVVLVEWKRF